MPFNTDQDSYRALRAIVSERTRPLLAFVGSGVSACAGLPTWGTLRDSLIEGLRNKASEAIGLDRKKLSAAADLAEAESNYWTSFQILAEHLGNASFRDLVREPFDNAFRAPTPVIYGQLWELGIKGMLTLNLDRLAVRSLSEARPGETPIEQSGSIVGRLREHLNGQRPYVANLHGIFEDVETWVFTSRELGALQKDKAYEGFLQSCLSMFTVIFVGISVDDIAVGGHLDRASSLNLQNPTHYWITPVREFNVDRWGESVGLRAIRYNVDAGDHGELSEALEGLRDFISTDAPDPPRVHLGRGDPSEVASTGSIPPENELLGLSPDELRKILNAHAQDLLSSETPGAYAQYDAFATKYDQAIYQAWYTSDQPGKNRLLGYSLGERVARGAFGVVYRASTIEGTPVAIKVLLDEVRQQPESLEAFRRGVRSMRILEEKRVDGMVTYMEASEIPAFVVMEWVEGPNLTDARRTGAVSDWYGVLDIALQLTRIIRTAHMLPERVLHRDIRPSNVMLRNFWMDQERREVVVLDFDLSWHRGSAEKSIVHSTSNGYLAPEQMRESSASTRSALVDSFGIAMTLFFLCSGKDPLAEQHLHQSWTEDVRRACESLPKSDWASLPARLTRLILAGAQHVQSSRWDLAAMTHELESLNLALHRPDRLYVSELIVEEVAARTQSLRDYSWDSDRLEASRVSATGLRLALRADVTNEEVAAEVTFIDSGLQDRAKLNKHISAATDSLTQQFKAAGWRVVESRKGYADLLIRAAISASQVGSDMGGTVKTLDRLFGRLAFD